MKDPELDLSIAELKGRLAALGAQLEPGAAFIHVTRPQPGALVGLVALDRVRDVAHPDYCIHGFASCIFCEDICYLGSETVQAVQHPRMYAMCVPCANILPSQHLAASESLSDHLRKDGAHGR